MTLSRIGRGIAFFVLSLAALASVMTLRCILEARAEHARADAALKAGDLVLAVSHYRRAARWDAPANAYAESALASLERIGTAAELRADGVLALSAYRAVHAAVHATRGAFVPHSERLARVDARIAALMAREPTSELDAGSSTAQREQRYRQLLQVTGPSSAGVVLACAGFFTWASAFALLVLRGLDREGRIVRQVARPSFLLLVFGWVAFAVGLRLA